MIMYWAHNPSLIPEMNFEANPNDPRTKCLVGVVRRVSIAVDGAVCCFSHAAAVDDDKLFAVNLGTAEMREAAPAPAPYHLASIGATGKLYVSSSEQPNIWVVDQKDLAVLGKIAVGGKGHQMVLSPGS